jgi:sugar (pentulose or hexulose) kinase
MHEEGRNAVFENADKLLFLPDLLAYYITGEKLAERTVSSVSQMYSFGTRDWVYEILRVYGLPKNIFGKLTDSGTVSGHTTREIEKQWGVNGFDFVSVCQHDTASAFLASTAGIGASASGNNASASANSALSESAIISSGTWALVGCETEKPVINDFGFSHNIANEGSFPDRHRLMRNVMGSWLLQEVRADLARGGKDYGFGELIALARRAEPFKWLVDVDSEAFFQPGDMQAKIRDECMKSYGGAPESPGQFVRCISESLALKYRWSVEKLETLTKRRFPSIGIVGGGSLDALTCGYTANACGRPVLAGSPDAAALGNIMVQLIAKGEIRDVRQGREMLARSFPQTEYLPENEALWNEQYQAFCARFGL